MLSINDWAQQLQSLPVRSLMVAVVLLSFGIYGRLNARSSGGHVLMTRFDRRIPVNHFFSIPYLLYFPYLLGRVVYGILMSPIFANIAASALAVQLSAAVIYKRHQTHVPRPEFVPNGFFSRLTAMIYRNDKPFCAFPSLHVAYSTLCAYWSLTLFPGFAWVFVVLSGLVIASTVFLKQHAIADVIAGVAIAALSLKFIG